jgi:hypothetical protein
MNKKAQKWTKRHKTLSFPIDKLDIQSADRIFRYFFKISYIKKSVEMQKKTGKNISQKQRKYRKKIVEIEAKIVKNSRILIKIP